MALTRRALLEQIGTIGGAGATYLAMEAMGLAIPTPAGAENFQLPGRSGNGRSQPDIWLACFRELPANKPGTR